MYHFAPPPIIINWVREMARYWVALPSGVVGPFEAEEVVRLPGFQPQWQICPERGGGDQWAPAREFPELRAMAAAAAPKRARVMAIDDDPSVRRVLKLRLELKGYEVALYENAPDALAALAAKDAPAPDLIICDVMMPGLDGYETCRKVRAMGAAMPFLFLTNKGASVDKVRGLEAGADDYILKPFDPHELEAKVARYVRAQPRP